MDLVLAAALSPDNDVRRQAEDRIGYAASQRGFAVALAEALDHANTRATDNPSTISGASSFHLRLMAGALLQRFVQEYWNRADDAVLPPEDKAQARCLLVERVCITSETFFFVFPLLKVFVRSFSRWIRLIAWFLQLCSLTQIFLSSQDCTGCVPLSLSSYEKECTSVYVAELRAPGLWISFLI